MIDCRQLIEFLMDYVDDELPAEAAVPFQRHLEACPDCLAYVDSYQRTVRLAQGALDDPEALCDDMPEDLVQAILAARGAS